MSHKIWPVLVIATMILSACNAGGSPTPLPTVVLQDNTSALDQSTPAAASGSSSATASGVLVADNQSDLAFLTGGSVKTVNVVVGQEVKTGDLLAALDDTILQAQLDQANLNLFDLTSPLAISQAQQAVADDKAALNSAQGTLYWWQDLLAQSADLLKKAQADLVIARDELNDAQEDYDEISGDLTDDKDKAIAYQKVYAAQQKVDDAQTRINQYSKTDPHQMAKYEAAVEVAKAKLAEDETLLAALTGGELPDNPTGIGYNRLVQARLNVQIAEANLRSSQLISPIDGQVSAVNITVGDFAAAGIIQIVVTDPLHLHVETSDLSERDVSSIASGQEVIVTVKPLGRQIKGVVSAVSSQADTLGGDVVYKAFIQLDDLPEGALPGMTVTVDFMN
jgi:multidrug efflux pump subunit AcrA (membrane-fusion protein)